DFYKVDARHVVRGDEIIDSRHLDFDAVAAELGVAAIVGALLPAEQARFFSDSARDRRDDIAQSRIESQVLFQSLKSRRPGLEREYATPRAGALRERERDRADICADIKTNVARAHEPFDDSNRNRLEPGRAHFAFDRKGAVNPDAEFTEIFFENE